MKKLIFLLFAVIITAGCTQNLEIKNDLETDTSKTKSEEEFNNSGQAKAILDESDLWMIYGNEETNFSLKYPNNTSLEKEEGKLSLIIDVQNINEMEEEAPLGFGKRMSLKTRKALLSGTYGNVVDFSLEISEQVRAIKEKNAQEFMVLSRFEVCDVTFERRLRFFIDDYQIILTLKAPKEEMVTSMPEYFEINTENCGENLIWNFEKQTNFYNALKNKTGGEIAQDWFDTFEKIVSTIDFAIQEDVNQESILGNWQSKDDEKYLINFSENQKTDYYNNEINLEADYRLDSNCLIAEEDDEEIKYEILKLEDNYLELLHLPRGNILKFERVSR